MSMKNITDKQVATAYLNAIKEREKQELPPFTWPVDLLMKETGECEKVCWGAMQRAETRGYIDYGVSLRAGFLTDKGKKLVSE